MTQEILFSVIVPVYNVEKYLPDCIESLIRQTYSNIEIVLVDDGSTDSSPQICDKYALLDSRVRVIHQKNAGVTSARIAGGLICRGDYIACVDADDWIENVYFERFAGVINKYTPEVISCELYLAFANKLKRVKWQYHDGYYTKSDIEKFIYPDLIQNPSAKYFPPTLCAKVITRKLYLQTQTALSTEIKIGEDGACMIACINRAESMYLLPDALYYYRQNNSSATKRRWAFNWNGPKLIAEYLEEWINLDDYDFRQQLYRKTVHSVFIIVISQFNRSEKYGVIKNDILTHLQEPCYAQAIACARFNGFNGRLAHWILKKRLIWLAYLIYKMR